MKHDIMAFLRATAVPFMFLGLCVFQSWELGEIHRQDDAVIRKDLADRLAQIRSDLRFEMEIPTLEFYESGTVTCYNLPYVKPDKKLIGPAR